MHWFRVCIYAQSAKCYVVTDDSKVCADGGEDYREKMRDERRETNIRITLQWGGIVES